MLLKLISKNQMNELKIATAMVFPIIVILTLAFFFFILPQLWDKNGMAKKPQMAPYQYSYDKKSVDESIKKDPRIKPAEARLIHRLLKGRHEKGDMK